ncbi:MAG: hypothetical protein HUU01_10965 [Saprospiraceae bacterium]|nr:hypothetical protein [Saprospiraceae bacterium]
METLNKHLDKPLTAILEQGLLPESQLECLLEDILQEGSGHLAHWLHLGLEPWRKLAYDTAKLGLCALTAQSTTWFEEHSRLLEKIFAFHWDLRPKAPQGESQNDMHQAVTNAIMALVDHRQAGLRLEFLDSLLSKNGLSEVEELKINLLKAKIKERLGFPVLEKRIDLENKPHLAPLGLYSYRLENPIKAIAFLNHLDDKLTKKVLDGESFDPVRHFFATYLRQAIFKWLTEGNDEDYRVFMNRRDSFEQEWFKSLFEEVMDHPGLEDINKRYEKLKNALTDKKHQRQGLEDIEKKI